MTLLNYHDFKKIVETKWARFVESEGHVSTYYTNSISQNVELSESDNEDKEKYELFLHLENQEYKRIASQEIPVAIQMLKEGTNGYCDITGKFMSPKKLFTTPIAQSSLNVQEQRPRKMKK